MYFGYQLLNGKLWTVFFFLDENNKQRLELFTQECQFNLVIIQIIKKNPPQKKGNKKEGRGFITLTTLFIQPLLIMCSLCIGPCIENVTKSRNVKNWVWNPKLEVS
jgi:hypothetical protein